MIVMFLATLGLVIWCIQAGDTVSKYSKVADIDQCTLEVVFVVSL